MKINLTESDIASLKRTGCLSWKHPDVELCLVGKIADEKKLDEGELKPGE